MPQGLEKHAAQFNENQWTECLSNCLSFSDFDVLFTATYGTQHHKLWRAKLSCKYSEKVFLFRGTPDIVLHAKKSQDELYVQSGSTQEMDNSDSEDSDTSSIHSGVLEMGMKNDMACATNSALVDKGGELVASLHLSLVSRLLSLARSYVLS